MPKPELHRDTIEIQSGRSSGGVGVGLRGLRLYSGRTYYRKKEIWLCHDCYLARSRRRMNRAIGGAAILLLAMLAVGFFRGNSTDAAKPQAVADSVFVPLTS